MGAVLMACFGIITHATAQITFNTTTALPVDLDPGTNYSSCAAPGTKAFTFEVECVGVLNLTDKQLAEVNIRLDATCGGNLTQISAWIKSPAGTCVQLFSTMGTTTNYNTAPVNRIDYTFRNGASCLNKIPDYAAFPNSVPTASNLTGRYGIFSTLGDLRSAFAGEDADGTWTIYFSENVASAPCVTLLNIIFGGSVPDDRRAQSDNCDTSIEWTGQPICASTGSKTPSTNSPGFAGGSFAGCGWNNSNDNDVWIAFTPVEADVCLTISGLTGDLQSIIVTDPNTDGDNNPCTGANGGRYWTVVSCPRDQIYAAVTGTPRNHNHCFTAVPGRRYYLVVDGNAGAISEFYINGTRGFEFNREIVCPPDRTACETDAPFALTGARPTGGNYVGTGVSNNIFNPAVAGPGLHVITYERPRACDTLRCTFVITVLPGYIPQFSFPTDICAGDTPPTLPPVSNNGVPGTWNPAVVNNTATGSYTFTPVAGQCAPPVTIVVNVSSGGAPLYVWNTYPAGALGANAYTNTQGTCSMTASVTGTEFVNAANNSTPPTSPYYTTAVGTGLHLRHNWSSTSPNPVTTLTLDFSPPITNPSFTIFDINRNGPNAICSNIWTDRVLVTGFAGATPVRPTATQANPAHQTISIQGNNLLMVGNETSFDDVNVFFSGAISRIVITYTSDAPIFSSNGCPAGTTNPTTQFITVGSVRGQALASPSAINGAGTICRGESATLTLAGGVPASQWYAGSCGGTLIGTGESIIVSPTVTTTYFATNSNCGCNTTCVSATVVVNLPQTPLFNFPDICAGETPPLLPAVSSNGISGSWSPPTVNNGVTADYTFTPNPGQCATGIVKTIVVEPKPDTSPIFRD